MILIPGIKSSQLIAKYDKSKAPNDVCVSNLTSEFLIWFNVQLLGPQSIDCLANNIKLNYNAKTKLTSDTPGVKISTNGFGQTVGIETIDGVPLGQSLFPYFTGLVNALVANLSYVKGVNIRGAPYDWRKAPNELQAYYTNLTQLVERTYAINNNTRVVIIAHSMGNPIVLVYVHSFCEYLT